MLLCLNMIVTIKTKTYWLAAVAHRLYAQSHIHSHTCCLLHRLYEREGGGGERGGGERKRVRREREGEEREGGRGGGDREGGREGENLKFQLRLRVCVCVCV